MKEVYTLYVIDIEVIMGNSFGSLTPYQVRSSS